MSLRYGLYQADPPDGDMVWFRTGRELSAGPYVLGGGTTPNAYIEESVAALILRVTPAITAAIRAGQEVLASPNMDEKARAALSDRLTDELIERLSRDDHIWEDDPPWLGELQPASGTR